MTLDFANAVLYQMILPACGQAYILVGFVKRHQSPLFVILSGKFRMKIECLQRLE